jgi:hypothetical protein
VRDPCVHASIVVALALCWRSADLVTLRKFVALMAQRSTKVELPFTQANLSNSQLRAASVGI